MSEPAEIIIIGAGIAGISLAAELSSHRRVLVLETEAHPGYHATGRSAAAFAPSYGSDIVCSITKASHSFFLDPPVSFSEARLLFPRDVVFLATHQQTESLNKLLDEDPHLIAQSSHQLRDLIPILKEQSVYAGAVEIGGGDLNVDALLQGFLKQLKRNDGRVELNAKVNSLTYKNGGWIVQTDHQDYETPIIVNAAGAWADDIASLAGLSPLGISPLRRSALLVDAPSGQEISNWPLAIDVDEGFYFKPDAGQLLISPADETPSAACDAYAEEIDLAIAIDRVQSIAELNVKKINHSWAGLRSFAPDRNFVVGFDPANSGFFWLAGQGGYGVQTSPGLSDLACHILIGKHNRQDTEPLFDLVAALSPERLLGGTSIQ